MRISPQEPLRSFLTLCVFEVNGNVLQVSIAEGELVLNQLQIKSTASAATATISHKPVEAKVSQVSIERIITIGWCSALV